MEAKKKSPTRSALGRGLSSLISTPVATQPPPPTTTQGFNNSAALEITPPIAAPQQITSDTIKTGAVQFLPIELLVNNPSQPRKEFKQSELTELSDSIKAQGVLQPVLVRPIQRNNEHRYEIVAGERRWRASKLANLTQLPVIIRSFTDREALEIAIIENVQRENLTPLEEAQGYQRLASEFSLNQAEIAERVGKDRATVANYLRLLKLPAEILSLLEKQEITMGHAKAILTIKEPSAQLSLARKTVKEKLSVRDLEAIVSRVVVLDAGHRLPPNKAGISALLVPAEEERDLPPTSFPEVIDRMRNKLGTKVIIKHHKSGRGRIEIEYFSEQELDRVVEQICK